MNRFNDLALYFGPFVIELGFVVLVGVIIYFITRDGSRFDVVRRIGERSGLEPIGYVDKNPASFIGIQPDPQATHKTSGRLRRARILWLRGRDWEEVSASQVLAMHTQGRLAWHTTPGRFPIALGRDSFQRFAIDNMLEDPGPMEVLQSEYWRGIKIMALLVPVLAVVAVGEYWLIANGYLFRR